MKKNIAPLCRNLSILYFLSTILSFSSWAQSGVSYENHSISYDTLVAGTGNDNHVFTLPQFDPSLGTLSSVNIKSVVSLNYGFTLTNQEVVQRNFIVSVGRYDIFETTATSSSYNNLLTTNVGSFLLNPGNTVSKTPYTIVSRYVNEQNISNDIAGFMGGGTVSFNYEPITYTNLFGSSHYNYQATANDTIHFIITYQYINEVVLAAGIRFAAAKENNETVKLIWNTSTAQAGLVYEIQKGTNGTDFFAAGKVNENVIGNYDFYYTVADAEKTKLYFRLKLTGTTGAVKFSEVKTVDMSGNTGKSWYLYPNPSNRFINIVFNEFKNRRVDILSANGSLVQQNRYANSNTAHIDFNHTLAAGVYFARVVDEQSQKIQVLSFVVR